MNQSHERSLRTVHNYSTFQNFCNLIEVLVFDFRKKRYNIRKFQEMRQEKITLRYGLETAFYRAPQLWFLVPAV